MTNDWPALEHPEADPGTRYRAEVKDGRVEVRWECVVASTAWDNYSDLFYVCGRVCDDGTYEQTSRYMTSGGDGDQYRAASPGAAIEEALARYTEDERRALWNVEHYGKQAKIAAENRRVVAGALPAAVQRRER